MNEIYTTLAEADPFSSWWPFIVAFLVGIVMTVKTFMGGQMCPSSQKCDNQIVVMTGATGGIGKEIAKELCARNVSHLILACRDIKKSFTTKTHLKKLYPNVNIDLREVNLESFDDVRQLADAIRKDYRRVDVLINGAGGRFAANRSADGCELNMQVNYLSHFLLSYLLLPLLKHSPQGRIINFSAHAYASVKFSGTNLLSSHELNENDAFALSKLAVVASSVHLARALKDSSNVTVNVLTPGIVRGTDHYQGSQISSALCPKILIFPWMWLFMKTPQQGAQTAIYLAVEPKLATVTGELFNDCEKIDKSTSAVENDVPSKLISETLNILKVTDANF